MNKQLLITNIQYYCDKVGIKPTVAFVCAGVGKNFLSNMKRGQTPSVAAVADLAVYLGVSTSDLIGDAKTPAELAPLAAAWAELNEEGRERLIAYAEDLVAGGRYIKNHSYLDAEGKNIG